ncbi:MAG: pectin acetylesterase-family hydrolase [Spirochaetota bacterium]|nr:pectin acetylesterase-family hydrolase [Spirochaetota bacterium]
MKQKVRETSIVLRFLSSILASIFMLMIVLYLNCEFIIGPDLPEKWTEYDPAELYPDFEYEGLTPSCLACPDCDPKFTFFAKGGRTNNLIIYFEGGGACWDSMNCLYVPTCTQEASSIDIFDNTEGRGIFDTDNEHNPFKDWHFVYIPYCTGDIHWGAKDNEYQDHLVSLPFESWTIRHRGHVNFQVVLKWIKNTFKFPNRIFITGSSAGAYGAIVNFPFIKEAFQESRIFTLGDAGNGVSTEEFQVSSIYNWNIQLPAWIPGYEDGYTPDMTFEVMYKDYANYYNSSCIAQFTTAWDWNQTFYYYIMKNINDPQSWEDDWPDEWFAWRDQMLEYAYSTAGEADNYRYYIASGSYHTIMMSPRFYTEDSTGIPFIDWINSMLNRGSINWNNLECEDCSDPVSCP